MDTARAIAVIASTSASNVDRVNAECALAAVRASPASVDAFLTHLAHAREVAEQHACAVMLSSVIAAHWGELDGDKRRWARSGILAALERASDRGTSRALANCIDVVAQLSVVSETWDDLLPVLERAYGSVNATHREAALEVYGALTTSLGERMVAHHEALLQMFVRALDDADVRVRLAAVDAIGKLAQSWCLQNAIGPTLTICAATLVRGANVALDVGDEKMLSALLNAMSALCGVRDEVYGPENTALIDILEVALRLATNVKLNAGAIRAPALLILTKLAKKHAELLKETMSGQLDLQYDPHVLGQGGPIAAALVPPMLTISLEDVDANDEDLDEDVEGEGLDEQSSSSAALARAALRALSATLSNHFTVAPVFKLLERTGASPSAPLAWKAFAAITEGAQGAGVTSHLPALIPELTKAIQSQDLRLRAAATEAASMIVVHCQPEVADEYPEQLFPLLVSMLTSSPRSSQWAAHAALAAMCENCVGEAIIPCLNDLIVALKAQLVDGNVRTAARATASFGAVSQCALCYFNPYAESVLTLLLARAKSMDSSSGVTELQSRSLAAMATILGVIGIEYAPPGLVELLLQTAASALKSTDTVARECAHECLGKIAVALEDKFEPFAIDAASAAITALGQDVEDASNRSRGPVTTGVVEEQMAAAEALGQYFNSGVRCLQPYLPMTLEALAMASSPKRAVPLRLMAIRATEFILTPWIGDENNQNCLPLCVSVFKLLCERTTNDNAPSVVLAGMQSMSELLDKAKQIVTLPPEVLESTKEAADVIIRWQSVCQVEFEAAEEAAEQDDDESDDDIFDTLVFWAERISPQDDSDCD